MNWNEFELIARTQGDDALSDAMCLFGFKAISEYQSFVERLLKGAPAGVSCFSSRRFYAKHEPRHWGYAYVMGCGLRVRGENARSPGIAIFDWTIDLAATPAVPFHVTVSCHFSGESVWPLPRRDNLTHVRGPSCGLG